MKKKKAQRTHVNRNLPKLGDISIPIPEGWFEVTSGELKRGDRYLDPDMLDSENEYDWWVFIPPINGRQLNVESLLAVIRKGRPEPEVSDQSRQLIAGLELASQVYGEALSKEDSNGAPNEEKTVGVARKNLLQHIANLEAAIEKDEE